jgi:hypothetical protein
MNPGSPCVSMETEFYEEEEEEKEERGKNVGKE